MRLPITDKFLWAVYKFFETTKDVLEPSEVFKLKGWSSIGPNVGKEFWRSLERKRNRRQFAQFIYYLKSNGYIKVARLKDKSGILLTQKGTRKALITSHSYFKDELALKKRKDKKWIMIIFDIPEKKRKYRDDLRNFLYILGFQCLQKSVWVSPFDILEKLREIIVTLNLDNFVRIFLIEEALI